MKTCFIIALAKKSNKFKNRGDFGKMSCLRFAYYHEIMLIKNIKNALLFKTYFLPQHINPSFIILIIWIKMPPSI